MSYAQIEPVSGAPSYGNTRPLATPWRSGLPTLMLENVSLRELQRDDAATLFTLLTANEVARFISPPPRTVEGFYRSSSQFLWSILDSESRDAKAGFVQKDVRWRPRE